MVNWRPEQFDENISIAHRRELKNEFKQAAVRESLESIGLSLEEYNLYKTLSHFSEIVSLALKKGISYYGAEIEYFDLLAQALQPEERSGKVRIDNPINTFAQESALRRTMWDEAE